MALLVDILEPNAFRKSGVQKPIQDAWAAGDWIGSFNLWIVRERPDGPAILYQQRSSRGAWAPGLLDVTAGGHYEAGEEPRDGLREVREEIGRDYLFEELKYLGKKLYLKDEGPRHLRYVVDVFIVRDDAPLSAYRLQREELDGMYECPLDDLVRVHSDAGKDPICQTPSRILLSE